LRHKQKSSSRFAGPRVYRFFVLAICVLTFLSNGAAIFSRSFDKGNLNLTTSIQQPLPATQSSFSDSFATDLSVTASGQDAQLSPDGLWSFDDGKSVTGMISRSAMPQSYRVVRLDESPFISFLSQAPAEFSESARDTHLVLSMPMPDGTFTTFQIEESPIMEPELAAKFPQIKTYRGQGIDDPSATARFDVTPSGLHAIIFSERGTVYIDPYSTSDTATYLTYYKEDLEKEGEPFVCHFFEADDPKKEPSDHLTPAVASGTTLRTYRLACAATGEYTNYFGGTKSQSMAAIATTINRVNGVYEREVAVRMILVANNDLIVYTDGATDPYTNGNGSAMLGENQANVDSVIGSANYDIGHVFSTGGGGIAYLNSVCNASLKARGVTGLSNPVGDTFAIDYVCHEIGHQFGARHTFNGSTGACGGGNRSSSAAYEPGSGSTLMSYSGICGAQNLQISSDPYFHVKSLEEINSFINGSGGSCAVKIDNGNSVPTVTGGGNYIIPARTPFTLTASGSDPDGDALTYSWEEYDLGPASPPDTDSDGQARPIFRSFAPTSSPSRTFPKLESILNNTPTLGEALPTIDRAMNFRITVRDNRAGGSAINTANAQLIVDSDSGPFMITQPNSTITWAAGSQQSITWDVAGTNVAPVSVSNVKISLSTDGGQTFSVVLAASTPNDGEATFTVPDAPTTAARIRVEAIGNVFFDISDANFTIAESSSGCSSTISPLSQSFSDAGGSGSINVTLDGSCPWTASTTSTFITILSGTSGASSGQVGFAVAANTSTNPREGTIEIGAQTFTVTQSGKSSCSYSISPSSASFSSGGGSDIVSVSAGDGCGWSATSNASFITIVSNSSGSGSGAISYAVAPNSGAARTGTMTVAGKTISITQAGASCVTSISPASRSFSSSGGGGSITVSAGGNCLWSAQSSAQWITVTANGSGSGNKTIKYSVARYTGTEPRTGTIIIGGRVHTVTQSGVACSFTLSASSVSIGSAGGSRTVNISAGTGCGWTAVSNASFITITSGTSGSGSGTVGFAVAQNTSSNQRTGTMTIAGQVFTVIQAGGGGGCNYSLSDSKYNMDATAGSGTISVATGSGCLWTAVTQSGFITVTSGASGSGSGVVGFSVSPNQSTSPRTGTLLIAGQTVTVTQGGATSCSYLVAASGANFKKAGGNGSVSVAAGSGCGWSAVSNVSWITVISGGSGSGSGSVSYKVATNKTGGTRTGTITIAGKPFTVKQTAF